MRKSSADTWVNCGLPAHSPTAQTSGARLEPVVDRDISPCVERDTGELERDPFGIGGAPGPGQDVAAFDGLTA